MTKIIFLDVDGVLNSWEWFKKLEEESYNEDFISFGINPESVQLLNQIVEKTNAKIVVSSTWRINYFQDLLNLLDRYDFIGQVIGKTDTSHCYDCLRGNLILKWIKDNQNVIGCNYHEYINYVILDDSSDMLLWQKDNFVQTNVETGLTQKEVDECIRILNQG